jgi:hypothetical protein
MGDPGLNKVYKEYKEYKDYKIEAKYSSHFVLALLLPYSPCRCLVVLVFATC